MSNLFRYRQLFKRLSGSWVWLFLLNCAASGAQLPDRPETLLPSRTVLLIDLRDLSELAPALKEHWFDVVFSEAIETSRLSESELPVRLEMGKIEKVRVRSWLQQQCRCFKAYEELQKIVQFVDHPIGPDTSVDEVLEKLSPLLPKRSFVGLGIAGDRLNATFGMDVGSSQFDWPELLKSMAHIVDADASIFQLGDEQLYFFREANCIYGTWNMPLENCLRLQQRVQGVERESGFRSLAESRDFQRVFKGVSPDESTDVFCFARVAELMKFASFDIPHSVPLGQLGKTKTSKIGSTTYLYSQEVFSMFSVTGLTASFGRNGRDCEYEVVYPVIEPKLEMLASMLNELSPLEINKTRKLFGGVMSGCYSRPKSPAEFVVLDMQFDQLQWS